MATVFHGTSAWHQNPDLFFSGGFRYLSGALFVSGVDGRAGRVARHGDHAGGPGDCREGTCRKGPKTMKPVCLVIGAGAGIGGTVGARFAAEGYHAVLCRRQNREGLETLVARITGNGGTASGFLLNAVEPDAIEERIAATERDIGPIEVVIFNLGAQIGNRELTETTEKQFERCWRMATFGLFRTARAVLPAMAERASGTMIVTSATAAMRGNPGQHAHAAAMAGRRMLCQTLGAEYASRGVHVCHVLIDGPVDAPDTVGLLLGKERFQALREARGLGKDGLLLPEQIAETYLHLHRQHRSAWSNEIDLRPWTDLPWWNSRNESRGF